MLNLIETSYRTNFGPAYGIMIHDHNQFVMGFSVSNGHPEGAGRNYASMREALEIAALKWLRNQDKEDYLKSSSKFWTNVRGPGCEREGEERKQISVKGLIEIIRKRRERLEERQLIYLGIEADFAAQRRERQRVARQLAIQKDSQRVLPKIEELVRTGRLHLGAE